MRTARRKALYVFLSSLLGILLFVVFERSLIAIYDTLGTFWPNIIALNYEPRMVLLIDTWAMWIAVFFGGWYGVWLGIGWYELIYEERGVTTWFHGFVPHHWRAPRVRKSQDSFIERTLATAGASAKSAPQRVIVRSRLFGARFGDSFKSSKSINSDPAWSLDDVSSPESESVTIKPTAKKRSPAKKAAKKTVRKSTRKTTKKVPEVE